MGQYYSINIDDDTLRVGFGESATNVKIVKDAFDELAALKLKGGLLLKINGAASLPVGFVIAHSVTHLYSAVAVWDPKLQSYVVVVSHHPEYNVGDLIGEP